MGGNKYRRTRGGRAYNAGAGRGNYPRTGAGATAPAEYKPRWTEEQLSKMPREVQNALRRRQDEERQAQNALIQRRIEEGQAARKVAAISTSNMTTSDEARAYALRRASLRNMNATETLNWLRVATALKKRESENTSARSGKTSATRIKNRAIKQLVKQGVPESQARSQVNGVWSATPAATREKK